jgi:hypothetical protein
MEVYKKNMKKYNDIMKEQIENEINKKTDKKKGSKK